MENWRGNLSEVDTSPEATLARIGQNRAKAKAEKEKEEKKKAHDKASRHIAQTVAGERSSGKVYPGTEQGEKDVRDMLELQKDIENAMETLGADRPEDIPYELAKEFALQLAGYGAVAAGARAYPHLEKWFKLYIKKYPFVLTKKGDPTPEWVRQFLNYLTTTADELPDIHRALASKTYLSKDLFEETKE